MPETSKHILSTFDAGLEGLRERLLWMATLTEQLVQTTVKDGLFRTRDQSYSTALADDEEIDQLEKEIDQRGLEILMLFQPVAADLRHVVSSMRVSQNLERIADHAVGIARKTAKLDNVLQSEEAALFQSMYKEVEQLLKDAITSFSDRNVDLAQTLRQRDKAIDAINRQVAEQLTQQIGHHPAKAAFYLNLVFIARHLERIADLAKYIGDDTVFAISAQDIRHLSASKSA